MNIIIEKLNKSFDNNVVLKDFSAVIPEGKTTCIMGRSGCGKTTLLNIMMNLLKPDSGKVSGMPAKIGAVFQENRLFNEFSAEENIKSVLKDKSRNVMPGLSALGLKDSAQLPVSELSGGMKRRVAILRAIEYGADMLIMDEPFKGLDAETKASVINYLNERTKGITLLAVTHDPEEAVMLGAEILQMEKLDE